MFHIFLDSVFSVEKWRAVVWGIILLCLSLLSGPTQASIMTLAGLLPWWAAPAFLFATLVLLLLRGLLKVNHDEFLEVENKRDEFKEENKALEKRLEEKEKRIALDDLLGNAHEAGQHVYDVGDFEAFSQWATYVNKLLRAAFGKKIAQLILRDSNSGPPLPSEPRARYAHIREKLMGNHLRRFEEIMSRTDIPVPQVSMPKALSGKSNLP